MGDWWLPDCALGAWGVGDCMMSIGIMHGRVVTACIEHCSHPQLCMHNSHETLNFISEIVLMTRKFLLFIMSLHMHVTNCPQSQNFLLMTWFYNYQKWYFLIQVKHLILLIPVNFELLLSHDDDVTFVLQVRVGNKWIPCHSYYYMFPAPTLSVMHHPTLWSNKWNSSPLNKEQDPLL